MGRGSEGAQKPKARRPEKAAEPEPDDKTPDPAAESNQAATSIPPATGGTAPISQHLPPLFELIEQGKVLALNMPAGINPALARAVGVMLKNAWLQALLMRPAKMKRSPGRYFRPAVFICDEYQAFASVGEDDPSGDEKSFALTRQCRTLLLESEGGGPNMSPRADWNISNRFYRVWRAPWKIPKSARS